MKKYNKALNEISYILRKIDDEEDIQNALHEFRKIDEAFVLLSHYKDLVETLKLLDDKLVSQKIQRYPLVEQEIIVKIISKIKEIEK